MSDDPAIAVEKSRRQGSGLSTKTKVLIGLGVYLGDRDPDVPDLRQRGQKRSLQAPERVQARTVGRDPPRRHRPQHQQGGPLPLPRQRPDDRHDGLDRAADAAEAEPDPDRGRGRLRPDQEHDHRRQPRRQDGEPLVPLPRHALLLDLVLEHDRLPAAADQHRAHGQRLRRRNPLLRDLRGDRQPLDPAGPDPGRLDLLPRRRDPGQGLLQVPGELAAARASRT